MAETPDVSRLNRDLDTERRAFSNLRRDLREALKDFSPPADIDERLIGFAEEFGAAHTAKTLADSPKQFGLKAKARDPALLALIPPLEAVHASNQRMDALIIERENILARSDPKRARVYISFGREFTLDIPNQQIRYVDTGEKEPLVVELVEPGAAAKRKARTKERERDR